LQNGSQTPFRDTVGLGINLIFRRMRERSPYCETLDLNQLPTTAIRSDPSERQFCKLSVELVGMAT